MLSKGSDKIYADRLKALRKKYRIQQAVIAEQLGLTSQQQYSDLERGKKHFTDEIVLRICSLFHISVHEFAVINKEKKWKESFMDKRDLSLIESNSQDEIKLLVYKKLFLETSIENTNIKLNMLKKEPEDIHFHPVKHRIYVIL